MRRAIVVVFCLLLAYGAFAQQPPEPKPTPGISVIHFVAPKYPPLAKTARVGGDVRVTGIVDREGRLQNVSADGHPMLKQAAIDTVKQWKFGSTRPGETAAYTVVIRYRIIPENPEEGPAPDHWLQLELPDRVTVWGERVTVEPGACGPPPRRRGLRCLYLWRCQPIPYGCQ